MPFEIGITGLHPFRYRDYGITGPPLTGPYNNHVLLPYAVKDVQRIFYLLPSLKRISYG